MLAGHYLDARADGRAVAMGAEQFDVDPIVFVAAVISQQRRVIVHVQDQYVHVTIVVKVAKGAAAAGIYRSYPRAQILGNVLELRVSQIAIDESWRNKMPAHVVLINLGINLAGDVEDIGPAVVVVIRKSRAPANILRIDAQPGNKSYVTERAVAVVVVEIGGVIGEIRLEDVK